MKYHLRFRFIKYNLFHASDRNLMILGGGWNGMEFVAWAPYRNKPSFCSGTGCLKKTSELSCILRIVVTFKPSNIFTN